MILDNSRHETYFIILVLQKCNIRTKKKKKICGFFNFANEEINVSLRVQVLPK